MRRPLKTCANGCRAGTTSCVRRILRNSPIEPPRSATSLSMRCTARCCINGNRRSAGLAGAEQIEEFAGVDDPENFRVFAEMLEVAGNKECRSGSIGAFVETVVGFVGGDS